MMITRVTVANAASRSISNVEAAAARLADLQDQISSGKRIRTPSDDPSGAVTAMQLRGELARNTQYAANSSDAISWLTTADSAFSQVVSSLQDAQTVVTRALNTGTNDASANAAMAAQLDGIRSTLISLANTSYNGRPIFGGTTSGSAAYNASGAYVGDTGTVTRAISATSTVPVATNGTAVFGDTSTGSDVFSMLANFSAALRSSPSTLTGTALNQLKSALSTVSTAQAAEGGVYQQVQQQQAMQASIGTSLQTRLGDVEQVDIAEMAVRVASANTSYQAALQTTSAVGRLSLMDFLR